MTVISDESAIKLHTAADGCVWYVDGIAPPVNSGLRAEEFLRQAVVTKRHTQVRLLGIEQNVALIVELFRRRQAREIAAVQLAGANGAIFIEDPQLALLQMRSRVGAPSIGGWHDMTMADYATYVLLHHLHTATARDNFLSNLHIYLRLHPAYKALQFIQPDDLAAAALLTTIIDPRWFVDTRSPDKASKLELYLGLAPKIQQQVSNPAKVLSKRKQVRCAMTLRCWKHKSSVDVNFNDPASFLWRIWKNAGGGWRGDLRASQSLIRYLRAHWLEALDTRPGQKDRLFHPASFFVSKEEVHAYKEHMQKKVTSDG